MKFSNNLKFILVFITLQSYFIFTLPFVFAETEENTLFNKVAFASMRIVKIKDNAIWNSNFRDLAKFGFINKLSSFNKVVTKLQQKKFEPQTATMKVNNKKELLGPLNDKALKEFHSTFNAQFDRFLKNISIANNAILFIFDSLEDHHAHLFVKDKRQKLQLSMIVYYLDSNTIGITYIELNQNLFEDPNMLKEKMHSAISKALEEALGNTEGLVSFNINNKHNSNNSNNSKKYDSSSDNKQKKNQRKEIKEYTPDDYW